MTSRKILLALLLALGVVLFAYAIYLAGHGLDESHSVEGLFEY